MEYKRLYIAYGSNINLQQMAHRCPRSKVVGTAMLHDYELEFRGVATIVPKKGSQVPVLLWEIDRKDELSLDRYEGFPNLYRKELFDVDMNGFKCRGMAYLMNRGTISPPSVVYYNGILKGYQDNGMDTNYLQKALNDSLPSHREYFDEEAEEEYEEEEDKDYDMDDDLQMTFK